MWWHHPLGVRVGLDKQLEEAVLMLELRRCWRKSGSYSYYSTRRRHLQTGKLDPVHSKNLCDPQRGLCRTSNSQNCGEGPEPGWNTWASMRGEGLQLGSTVCLQLIFWSQNQDQTRSSIETPPHCTATALEWNQTKKNLNNQLCLFSVVDVDPCFNDIVVWRMEETDLHSETPGSPR